ncbi:MAG TPA: mitochondrial fission ELM1 family protein [Xanthomonadaceae bacterium]|jgi:hypothetical protein
MASAIWVVTDGRAGNERQALALARALAKSDPAKFDGEPRIWRLQALTPWKQAAPRRLPGSERAFGEAFQQALRDPPDLAIGCGRQAALATRLLRAAGARVVQILDPRIDPRHWDAVVVPEHDRLRGPNVIAMLGSLHEVDADWLAQARARHPQFECLPAPRSLLLLGGPIRNVALDETWWRRTIETLRAIRHRDGGSLSVCASRRTPGWMVDAARRDLPGLHGAHWLASDDGPNPYPGLLAWADRIVVSPDSVNMISEAVATNAVVSIADPGLARGRHASFLDSLLRSARVQALDLAVVATDASPLRELPRVTGLLRERGIA